MKTEGRTPNAQSTQARVEPEAAAAYDVSVNVVFFGGAEFDPPPPLGTTGRTQYVKLRSLDEVEQPDLQKWIEQAALVPGWN